MSRKEIDRMGIIQRLEEKGISQVEAGKRLDLNTRQIRALCVFALIDSVWYSVVIVLITKIGAQ